MKYCSTCGKQILDEAIVCPGCGCGVVAPQKHLEDKISVGLCILAALIPLFGFIYWPVKHNQTPKRAQACGITAIIAFIIYFILMI